MRLILIVWFVEVFNTYSGYMEIQEPDFQVLVFNMVYGLW